MDGSQQPRGPMDKADKNVSIMLTQKEFNRVSRMAEQDLRTVSNWIRKAILDRLAVVEDAADETRTKDRAPEAGEAEEEAVPEKMPELVETNEQAVEPVVHTTIPTVTGKVVQTGRVWKMELSVNGKVVVTAVSWAGGYAIDEDVSHPMVADFLPPDALRGKYAGKAQTAAREMKTKILAAFVEKYPDAKASTVSTVGKPKLFRYRTAPVVHTTIPTVTGKVTQKGRVRKMDLSVNGEVVATAVAEGGGYTIAGDVSHPMVADFLPPYALHGEYAGNAKAATREMKTKVMAAFKEKYPDAKPPPRARRAKKPKPFKYRTDPIELYVPESNPVLPDILQAAKLESHSGHPIELPDDAPYERALLLFDLSQDPDVQTVAKDFLINAGFPDDMVGGIAGQTRHHLADAFERQDPKAGEAITLGRFTVIKDPSELPSAAEPEEDTPEDAAAGEKDAMEDAGEPEPVEATTPRG